MDEKVISKEDAVFWLDKNGCWRNANGKFEHNKIIDYFHACIKRDRGGYYLSQINGNYKEKVYFPYEDQALFVFDVIRQNDVSLILNTNRHVTLKPEDLFIKNDNLYMRLGDETIKFAEKALVKIANLLEDKAGQLYIRIKNNRHKIPILDEIPENPVNS